MTKIPLQTCIEQIYSVKQRKKEEDGCAWSMKELVRGRGAPACSVKELHQEEELGAYFTLPGFIRDAML